MGFVRSFLGFQDYEPKYRTIDSSEFELYKKELIENMYQDTIRIAEERTGQAYDNLQESRGLQRDTYDRIAGDGTSLAQKQAEQLLDRTTGQTASLTSNLPTGANTSALGRDLVRGQADTAGRVIGDASLARIMEERERQNALLSASQGLTSTDMGMAQLGIGQGQFGMAGLQNLSQAVSALQAERERQALGQHINLETLRQRGIDSTNRGIADIYGAVARMATPFIGGGTGGATPTTDPSAWNAVSTPLNKDPRKAYG